MAKCCDLQEVLKENFECNDVSLTVILDNNKLHIYDFKKEKFASNPLQSRIRYQCGLMNDIQQIINDSPVITGMTNKQIKILDDWYLLNKIVHNTHQLSDKQAGWSWSFKLKKNILYITHTWNLVFP